MNEVDLFCAFGASGKGGSGGGGVAGFEGAEEPEFAVGDAALEVVMDRLEGTSKYYVQANLHPSSVHWLTCYAYGQCLDSRFCCVVKARSLGCPPVLGEIADVFSFGHHVLR